MGSLIGGDDLILPLVGVLQWHPAGLTAGRLADMLHAPKHHVQMALMKLQAENRLHLRRGVIWQLRLEHRPAESATTPEIVTPPGAAKPARETMATQSPSYSRWAEFRRLCLYYAECVRIEDRAKVSEYADRENTRFLSLPQGINWNGLSKGATVALDLPPEWAAFARHIRSWRTGSRLFLGAPVDVMVFTQEGSKEKTRLISPVFVLQVEFEIRQTSLYLRPVGPVEINHGWLEHRFRQPDDRRVFLETVGLDLPEPADEDSEVQRPSPGFPDLCQAFCR